MQDKHFPAGFFHATITAESVILTMLSAGKGAIAATGSSAGKDQMGDNNMASVTCEGFYICARRLGGDVAPVDFIVWNTN